MQERQDMQGLEDGLEEEMVPTPLAQSVQNRPAMQETWVQSLREEDPLEKDWATHSIFLPGGLHYRGDQQATVHEVARVGHDLVTKSPPPTFLAWKIPCTEKPGGLQSMDREELDMTKWLSTAQHSSHKIPIK